MTISRKIEKIGLSPGWLTENELRDDTRQDLEILSACCWQGPPIVYSACVPHAAAHALTQVSDAVLLAESTQECKGTDGALALHKNSSWLGCQLSEQKSTEKSLLV